MTKARDLANAADVLDDVSATELSYVNGVTSAIQTQIDSKIGSASAISPTIVDAKGDIIAATAADTVSRLAVGSNNQVLTADSSTATGLKWADAAGGDTFTAGKNKIINGDFAINQRAFSSTTSAGYMFDRWTNYVSGGTTTFSAQTFTPGTAPVTGYEAKNFIRCVTTGQTTASSASLLIQAIEDVRTFANQTVTVSFWAKANTGTPKIAIELEQGFGTGGSPSAGVFTYAGQVTLSTSWARYSVTATVPSISGKTIGTTTPGYLALGLWMSAGSDFNARTGSLGIQTNTFDIWGAQVEAGSTATTFQTATGNIQSELTACQRYYFRQTAGSTYTTHGVGYAYTTDAAAFYVKFPTRMRIPPTSIEYSNLAVDQYGVTNFTFTTLTMQASTTGVDAATVQTSGSTGLTVYRPYGLLGNNSTSNYLGFSAEL